MIKPIQATLHILRGNINHNGKTVPVIKRNYPLDKTPCINIDDSASVVTINKKIYNRDNTNTQTLRIHRKTILNIHLWCDNEQDREDLSNQITTLFNMAWTDHYFHCKNYNRETMECNNLQRQCPTITQEKHLYKSSKNKCPQPQEYGYRNIFTEYDLIKASWDLQTPYSNDNIQTKPPTLHNIFKLNTEYYDYVDMGGITSNKLIIKQ